MPHLSIHPDAHMRAWPFASLPLFLPSFLQWIELISFRLTLPFYSFLLSFVHSLACMQDKQNELPGETNTPSLPPLSPPPYNLTPTVLFKEQSLDLNQPTPPPSSLPSPPLCMPEDRWTDRKRTIKDLGG
mmetsp:Transcript_29805/g.58488  ORF Transcript_29805/g.58488 Transcript_29805/m.58488 type:complete len:130 (+) Transcript_29805:2286-2675(+)